jgi:hypothetical protein
MKKILKLVIVILILSLTGCYTQFQMVDRGNDSDSAYYYEKDYYASDSSYADDGVVQNYYIYNPGNPYYYDDWYDFGYWSIPPRWGFYVSSYGWDPYWYPRWSIYSWYPYLTASPWYYSPWGYYDYYYPYHNYGNYYYSGKNFKKRDWQRRSENPVRRITRGNGQQGKVSNGIVDNRRINRRGVLTADNKRTSDNANRHIIRPNTPRRILRTDRNNDSKSSIRSNNRTGSRIYRGSSYAGRKSSQSGTRSSVRRSTRSGSSTHRVAPHRSSGRHSGSSIRGSSGRSSGSHSSGSSSRGSSRSSSGSSRSAKRR